MQTFRGKTAVVTGAASGIGLALAQKCVTEGMNIVLADVDGAALEEARSALTAHSVHVHSVQVDVSDADDVATLARETIDTFGGVHLLFNNAGVGHFAPILESSVADWRWVLGVNLLGVVHGVTSFAPLMLDQDEPSHIVNTASAAGFLSDPHMGAYKAAKHAVASLSETLRHELAGLGDRVKVSLLVPPAVDTAIMASERNRPAALHNPPGHPIGRAHHAFRTQVQQAVRSGMPPEEVADHTFEAIQRDRFYILLQPDLKDRVRERMEDLLQERDPARRGRGIS